MSQINAIYNASVYIDGNIQLGKAAEFKLPEFEFSQDEHKGLGMVGTIKLPSGVEALEGEITWNSFYPEVAAKACHPFKAVQLMVRANLQTFDARGLAREVHVVTMVTATFSKNALGTFKPKEKSEHSSTYQASEIRQMVDGREVLYYNAYTNAYIVNGVDVLAQMRRNIGQ
ncbi:phage major tail tube protein [Paralysiella testudinis]|uniref:Phage major tail tube protein n=1 Tax=Paralysiella testudinis TaxID=2809020 RepID=A0A892ZHU0_9NEIS|nr:phage major tail tube protein [Paralysiella testudinis]QRQ82070.1 phage major tail tube protein [Paralysiella testudinis]